MPVAVAIGVGVKVLVPVAVGVNVFVAVGVGEAHIAPDISETSSTAKLPTPFVGPMYSNVML